MPKKYYLRYFGKVIELESIANFNFIVTEANGSIVLTENLPEYRKDGLDYHIQYHTRFVGTGYQMPSAWAEQNWMDSIKAIQDCLIMCSGLGSDFEEVPYEGFDVPSGIHPMLHSPSLILPRYIAERLREIAMSNETHKFAYDWEGQKLRGTNPRKAAVAWDQKETDPSGLSPNTPGAKCDAGKIDVSLMLIGFTKALDAVAHLTNVGAKKYSKHGWRQVDNGVQRYNAALYRHYKMVLSDRHRLDPDWLVRGETVLEATAVAWNALAVLELILQEAECPTTSKE